MYQIIDIVTGEAVRIYDFQPIETDSHYVFGEIRYYKGDYKVRYTPN